MCGTRTGIYVDNPEIKKEETTMDLQMDRKHVYRVGEGDSNTDAVACTQVSPTASSFYDHGRSGVDCQAPGCVYAPGEVVTQIMEVAEEVR